MRSVLFSIVLSSLLIAGCTTTQPQAVAYVTLSDTWTTVKGAMRVYAVSCKAGKIDATTQGTIDMAYADFYISFNVALKLAQFDYGAPTPEAQNRLATELVALITQIQLKK